MCHRVLTLPRNDRKCRRKVYKWLLNHTPIVGDHYLHVDLYGYTYTMYVSTHLYNDDYTQSTTSPTNQVVYNGMCFICKRTFYGTFYDLTLVKQMKKYEKISCMKCQNFMDNLRFTFTRNEINIYDTPWIRHMIPCNVTRAYDVFTMVCLTRIEPNIDCIVSNILLLHGSYNDIIRYIVVFVIQLQIRYHDSKPSLQNRIL